VRRASLSLAAVAAAAVLIAGCTPEPDAPHPPQPDPFVHVHAVAIAPQSDTILVATHTGVYTVDEAGEATGPLGGHDFDAMGFATAGEAWFASGHPGPSTPAALGSPNLGIIRSDDDGQTWHPVAFTGVEDFHVLEAGRDGILYGVGSTSAAVRTSSDLSVTWDDSGEVDAADLAPAADGRLYAATPDGVYVRADSGASFVALAGAPRLYLLDALPDSTLIGVDTDAVLWRSLANGQWESVETVQGTVQALTTTDAGAVILIDDRGIVRIDDTGTTIIRPAT